MTGIDFHMHPEGGEVSATLLCEGERLGIDRFVGSCLGVGGMEQYPTQEQVVESNRAMRALMLRYSDRLAGLCYLNPRHGSTAVDEMRRCIEEDGMSGVKLWVAVPCDDPLVFPIVEQAIAYRAPILIHSWRKTVGQLPYESTAHNVAALAGRYPEVRIVMAHLGGQVESALDAIAPYPNVFTDTSGSIIDRGQVQTAVARLGAERVVFGSDTHAASLARNVGKVLGAGLDERELALIMGGNAERLLAEVAR